ncbi:MAG: leucine-rich repeat domain-containing protein [Alphaproteobacteria bacterium]|nr:leucine-rich repeat domain-containing protein [Alphaproteobacteria bacterium]
MKHLPLLLILTLFFEISESLAQDEINCNANQQSCGQSCCWSVENTKLVITGGKDGTIGTMDDYAWGRTGQNTQWPANITSIYVSGVENIGSEAFRNMRKVTDITIGDSVKTVGHGAFDNDNNLRYVDFGDAVTSIGSEAFQDAAQLIQIIVPDTLEDINNNSLGSGNIVSRNIQIICRGDKASCSGVYEKLLNYKGYDATSVLSYANYEQCISGNYYWDGTKCVREPDVSKRACCPVCADLDGYCSRIRYTIPEADELTSNDNENMIEWIFE